MTQLELPLIYPSYEVVQEYEGDPVDWLMGTFTDRNQAIQHCISLNDTASAGYTYAVYQVNEETVDTPNAP